MAICQLNILAESRASDSLARCWQLRSRAALQARPLPGEGDDFGPAQTEASMTGMLIAAILGFAALTGPYRASAADLLKSSGGQVPVVSPHPTAMPSAAGNADSSKADDGGHEPSYLEKRLIDLATNAYVWILVIALMLFRRSIGALIMSLQSVKIGPVELVLAAIESIKTQIEVGDLYFDLRGTMQPITYFAEYPKRMEYAGFLELFFRLDWASAFSKLSILESRLAVQEDRLRSSPYFTEEQPPVDFVEAKSKLFLLFVSIGNFYGFGINEETDVRKYAGFATTAESYLKKAIGLRPQAGADSSDTVGYAHFCLAVLQGLRGISMLGGKTIAESEISGRFGSDPGKRLIQRALEEIDIAESFRHRPSYQSHLKAYLLYHLDDFAGAADAWEIAATFIRRLRIRCATTAHVHSHVIRNTWRL